MLKHELMNSNRYGFRGYARANGSRPHFAASNRSGNRNSQSKKLRGFDTALLIRKAEFSGSSEAYVTVNTFSNLDVIPILKENIRNHGYVTPTPIQDQAIPHLLDGKDVVGIANTGTGKTAAFLIPIVNKIYYDQSQRALIIAPTRELAVQIYEEALVFGKGMGIRFMLCIGGVSINPQLRGLRDNPHVVIGTPGRLKDLENRHAINFVNYRTIVLDEVDRMLDMGFIHSIKHIISHLPQNRQSLFFSATLSSQTRQVMQEFLKDPVTISIRSGRASDNVDQDVVKLNGRQKVDILHDLLIQDTFDKVIVFGRTKWGIERLNKELKNRGFGVAALHGNKTHGQRQKALQEFRKNQIKVLLATDVASRGLDIDNVSHVINYDLPETYEDYIHRIGRTGRAGKIGKALSFVD